MDRDEVIRKTIEIFHGATTPIKIWHPIISNSSGTIPEEVQNIAFPIFFECVRDMAMVPSTKLERLIRGAKNADNNIMLSANIEEIGIQCTHAIDFVSSFSEDTQIYLHLLRNRICHGYLEGTAQASREFKIFDRPANLLDFPFNHPKKARKSFTEQSEIRTFFSQPNDGDAIAKIRKDNAVSLNRYLDDIYSNLFVSIDQVKDALQNNWLLHAQGRSIFGQPRRRTID